MQRDFLLFAVAISRSDYEAPWAPPEPDLGPAGCWLHLVADAEEELAQEYLAGLLRQVPVVPEPDAAWPAAAVALAFARLWLRQRRTTANEAVWDAVRSRLAAAGDDDIDAAATWAAADLPGATADEAAFRALAVDGVVARMRAATVIRWTGPLGELRRLLERRAPELLQRLHRS